MLTGLLLLAGRVLLVVLFLLSGVGKLLEPGSVAGALAAKGFPLPWVSAFAAAVVLLAASAAILAGYRVALAAFALIGFTVLATLLFHDFWNMPSEQVVMQRIQFLKNLSIIGGLLVLAATGPGPIAGRGQPR